jgi:O-antigen biosynthesis protein
MHRHAPTPKTTAVRLEAEDGTVALIDGRTVARSVPVWLRVSPRETFPPGRRVRVRYRSSFFDDPVRPLIRFNTVDGRSIVIAMNGPVLGRGEWVGRIPSKTVTVAINPVSRPGPFEFAIDSVEVAPRLKLLLPVAQMLGSKKRKIPATKTALENYHLWHARLARTLELDGIDRPRSDWRLTPAFFLFLRLQGAGIEDLETTLQSLKRQAYERWRLCANAQGATAEVVARYEQSARDDPRLLKIANTDLLASLVSGLADCDCVTLVAAGDTWPDYALAILAERLAAEPELAAVYGDDDSATGAGLLHSPRFKPDWSPLLERHASYVGRPVWLRVWALRQQDCAIPALVEQPDETLARFFAKLPRKTVGHIRRILCHRPSSATFSKRMSGAVQETRLPHGNDPAAWPQVTIVVPTRDKADLLRRCAHGLKQITDYPNYNAVIVDNGTTDRAAVALLDELKTTPGFIVLDRPGPFNFSALSNDGARQTRSPVLVFMNNDVSMIDPGWLKAMVRWAVQPDIGAVGAKLLYPSGAIQHAGVIVGLGGIAAHVYRNEPRDEPGYLGELLVPHEVAAVTAACIAIERSKFEAVGGFDAENLPVELNDIDFCLRVAERGFTNFWTPEAVLYHHEFGSRQVGLNPSKTYRRERQYFLKRWQHVVRDDPYFHAALSLEGSTPMLG